MHEVYNHHWLIGTQSGDVLSDCEGDLYFGAGAEMRGVPKHWPEGYGFRRINAADHCGGNLHFIRTEDLKTKWDGMNDPSQFPADMQLGAAVKNCIECGWAPGRSISCGKGGDGGFECCVQGSRCPVNNPSDRSKKAYHLKYVVKYVRDLTAIKPIKFNVINVGGGAVEWNVAPNLNKPGQGQTCNDTVCHIQHTWTVDHMGKMGGGNHGICPGTMLWSYVHMHNGAMYGSLNVNGKEVCRSKPKIGTDTDPTNVGNEKGYAVGFEMCIDKDIKNNAFRLNKGDQFHLEAFYDVDPKSMAHYPMPGGKHGGIMTLFFYSMDCDPGTYTTSWACRDNQCIEALTAKGEFETEAACSASCGAAVI